MNLLKDATGYHDLDRVVSISPLVLKTDRQNPTKVTAVNAALHMEGGTTHHTVTDFRKAVAQWEGKPLAKPAPPEDQTIPSPYQDVDDLIPVPS